MTPERICGSTRLVVTLNAAYGYAVIYLIRVQFSVSILCMVRDPLVLQTNQTGLINGSAYFNWSESGNDSYSNSHLISTTPLPFDDRGKCGREENEMRSQKRAGNNDGDFLWDKPLQGLILSAFFWGYAVPQIPSGWLASRFGPKHVITIGMFVANLAHILTPLGATLHPYCVVGLRVLVGIGHAVMFPSLHALFGKWEPPLERSILMTPTYSGGIVTTFIGMALTGVLCDLIGWRSIFYIYGIISYIWLILWCYNVYNSPAKHPRISIEEKDYIQTAIGPSAYAKKADIPWLSIFRSGPVWAIIAAHFADNWGQYTVATVAPLYMKEVLGMDIQSNGLLAGFPFFLMAIAAVTCSQVADWLRRKHIMSTTHVRKLAQSIGFLIPTVFIVSLGFVPCSQRALAVVLLTLSVTFQAFGRVAYSINHVDIAPRLSGLLCGVSNTFATVPGMVSPYLSAALTPNGTQEEWRHVFFLCGAIYILGLIVYLLLGSGEEQEWAKTPQGENGMKLEMNVTQLLSDSSHRTEGDFNESVNKEHREKQINVNRYH